MGRTYYKMSISEKVKAVNNKIEQTKAQYNLDKQTVTISASSSGNASNYEFLTGKDFLPEKYLLEKAAALKRFQYAPLGKELNSTKILMGLLIMMKKKNHKKNWKRRDINNW